MEERKPVLTTNEFANKINKPVSTVQSMIRKHEIQANKIGKTYLIPISELDKITGVVPTDELSKLRLENERLKNKLENYKRQYSTVKQLMQTMEGVINIL
ncbi:hypothetical protein IO99_17965 [Clostridium sulfidigenes]|uniref:Helix-turn-helix domain-containing protein n=1 Tax=Clostridium sulfidigenes TaxID=318464 RepID=A0A084J7F4_9CLOT|nr:helix-turn-helix domain-containing protein [Clostridium sulfidigenes]KEZ84888.1 hypothetical protein IO99_17965 [Clostridium sulfidigenes]